MNVQIVTLTGGGRQARHRTVTSSFIPFQLCCRSFAAIWNCNNENEALAGGHLADKHAKRPRRVSIPFPMTRGAAILEKATNERRVTSSNVTLRRATTLRRRERTARVTLLLSAEEFLRARHQIRSKCPSFLCSFLLRAWIRCLEWKWNALFSTRHYIERNERLSVLGYFQYLPTV